MLIANTGQSLVIMNLRTGEQVSLPPGRATPLADSKIQYIDDSAVLISLFNTGVLVAYTDAGEAYPGFPTTANPADSKTLPPVDADYAAAVVGAAAVATTWANRAQAQAARFAFFTDIGIGGGSYGYYTGGRWRPYGGRVTLKNLTSDISNNAATKIVMDYCALPAGLWQDGDRLEIEWCKDRTGGTADTDQTEILLGTAPTTLGTSLGLVTSGLATSNIQLSAEYKLRRVSSTSVRTQSIQGSVGFGTQNSNSVLTTVSNLDSTDTYLQITSDLTTAGGEVVVLRSFVVTLVAGA